MRRQNFANTLQPHCAHYLTLRLNYFAPLSVKQLYSQELENKPQHLRDLRGLLMVEVFENRNNYHQIQSQYHSIRNNLNIRWKCSPQRGARLVQKRLLGQKSGNIGS